MLIPLTPVNKAVCLFDLGDPTFLSPVILQPPVADLQPEALVSETLQQVFALKDSTCPMAVLSVR